MVKVLLGAGAAVGALTALSIWNYRRFFPKPRAMGEDIHKVEVKKLPISSGNHTLYGELILPQGQGGGLPTIICSHGFDGSYHYFRDSVGMCLAMSGFAVYCFDFYAGSAHGKSGGSMTEMSVFSEREQLHDVIEAVKGLEFVDRDNLFLWGESQGGFVTAITAAWHTQDVKALVLYYPAFCARDDLLKRYTTLDEVPDIVDIMGKKVGRVYYEKLFDFDAYSEAKKFTGPVLIVHGDADKTVDVSYGKKAAETYENAKLEILPGEDHGFSAKGKLAGAKLVYDFFKDNLTWQSNFPVVEKGGRTL